jgi:ceramide glucosyltransferase
MAAAPRAITVRRVREQTSATVFTALQILLFIPVVGGSVFSLLCLWALHRFMRRAPAPATYAPPVTLLKPVYGLERGLEENVLSFCHQDYPDLQIVLCVQRLDDPAVPILRTIAAAYPERVTLVVQSSPPVLNGKVQNLVNGLAASRHEILIISDSDVRAAPDYVRTIVAPLVDPSAGYVCTLYRCGGAVRWYEKLELLGMEIDFLPSVVFSLVTGTSPFCTGASIAFRKTDLDAIGGMASLTEYLVEDYELGRRLAKLRGRFVVVPYLITLMVDFPSFRQWWHHQLYWDQNTWVVNQAGFTFTFLIRAVPFALALWLARGCDAFGLAVLAAAVGLRVATAGVVAGYLRHKDARRALWLLPLRDVLGLVSWFLVLTRRSFVWRGHRFGLNRDGRIVPRNAGGGVT